jgi:hypothetical protein
MHNSSLFHLSVFDLRYIENRLSRIKKHPLLLVECNFVSVSSRIRDLTSRFTEGGTP